MREYWNMGGILHLFTKRTSLFVIFRFTNRLVILIFRLIPIDWIPFDSTRNRIWFLNVHERGGTFHCALLLPRRSCRQKAIPINWGDYIPISFQIEWDMVMVTVFLSILNQMEIHLVQNRKEHCHHDHIPFNVKGNGNTVFSVHVGKGPGGESY